jgi:cbb3-type cytochrome oxidase subunit 3
MSTEFEVVAGLARGFMAGVLLVIFIGLWVWAFAAKRRKLFESASRLPLEEDGFSLKETSVGGDAP